jgi:hypothetical protein
VFDKLDAYNLVANLVPGMALTYVLSLLEFPVPRSEPILPFLLVSFVVGVATNRLGSLVFDPFLRWKRIKFLHEKDYIKFIHAEKDNHKLDNLVADSGLYRTFFTACFVLLTVVVTRYIVSSDHHQYDYVIGASTSVFMLVFLFSIKKEDSYIHSRINSLEE